MKVYDMTVPEAARRKGVHDETIRRWVRAGDLEARKNKRGHLLLNADDIDAIAVTRVVEYDDAQR